MRKYKLEDIAPIKQGVCDLADKIWLLNLDAVESDTGRVIDYVYASPEEVGNSTIAFDTTNVLYSKLRPYLNKVVLPEKAGFATSEMLPLKPDTSVVLREYLTYFLRSKSFVEHINSKTAGAKMPRANTKDLKNTEVPCPDIETQIEIVKQLDACVSVLEKRNKQIQYLDELIKARFVEMFDSNNYPKASLRDITSVITKGTTPTTAGFQFQEEGINFFKIESITEQHGINLKKVAHVSTECHETFKRSQLKRGDILFSIAGAIGRTAVIEDKDLPGNTNQALAIIRLDDGCSVSRRYLISALESPHVSDQYSRKKRGVAQINLSLQDIGNLELPVPDEVSQQEFEQIAKQVDKSKFV